MSRKQRADGVLNALPLEQQEAVFAQCERMTGKAGCSWLKSEFDIAISEQRLGVWLTKQRKDRDWQKLLSSIREDRDRAKMLGASIGTAADLTEANISLISQVIFEELRKSEAERDADKIAMLMTQALKARDQNLKERNLELELEKFKASIRSKLQTGLEALAAELQGNAKALALYQQLKEALAA